MSKNPNPIRGATLQTLLDILTIRGYEVRRLTPKGNDRARWSTRGGRTVKVELKRLRDDAVFIVGGATYGLAVRNVTRLLLEGHMDEYMDYEKKMEEITKSVGWCAK